MQNLLDNHPYIIELLRLDEIHTDRREFHKNVEDLLVEMGSDKEFLKLVIKRNFTDKGYLTHKWSKYNIPFFYVYETNHFNLKIHLFPSVKNKSYVNSLAVHCIHHHNNYLLTSNAFYGSGYESFLFEKNKPLNLQNLSVNMKVTKQFHQRDWNPSIIDSWEPHVIFAPESLSATLAFWTPDKKRPTDNLRNQPFLKSIKMPLKYIIARMGLTNKLGLALEKTYQFYPQEKIFKAIEESEYFSVAKSMVGPKIDSLSMQMIFYFIQKLNLEDKNFLRTLLTNDSIPNYYHPWINKVLKNEEIEEVFHEPEINIPGKMYFKDDVLRASKL